MPTFEISRTVATLGNPCCSSGYYLEKCSRLRTKAIAELWNRMIDGKASLGFKIIFEIVP